MRTVSAVVNGTEATWIEASTFPDAHCLRLWIERSFPDALGMEIAEVVASKPRGGEPQRLRDDRAFVLEPKGYGAHRPSWVPSSDELEFRDTFGLVRAQPTAEGYYSPYKTKGPLLVARCEETGRWLGAALEEDHDAWSLNLRLLFKKHCHEVGDGSVWELPS